MLRALIALLFGARASNLNGNYIVASGARQNVSVNTDYASQGSEYFDLYSLEVATQYGEVYWTDQGTWALPDDIVKRFQGKVMAVTGYEVDQVMVVPQGQPGVNPELDVSVPLTWAYNHHFSVTLLSAGMEVRKRAGRRRHGHEGSSEVLPRQGQGRRSFPNVPNLTWFSEGNGGEMRKSYHGYPQGFAQLIQSPAQIHFDNVMQIDTRNRDCGATIDDIHNCTEFIPGPEPKQARYGRGIPAGSTISGLIECPCTSDFGGDPIIYPGTKTKQIVHDYLAMAANSCPTADAIATASDCFAAAASMLPYVLSYKEGLDVSLPSGCSVSSSGTSAIAFFNHAPAPAGVCSTSMRWSGTTNIASLGVLLQLDFDFSAQQVTITASGPADVWFGIGFNAQTMADQPWAIIVNASGVNERRLGMCTDESRHCPGPVLAPSVATLSNRVLNGVRTVVVLRPFAGPTDDYFTFDPASRSTFSIISAIGFNNELSYHAAHAAANITAIATDGSPTCLCDAGAVMSMCEADGSGCSSWVRDCRENLALQQNPTCTSTTYAGGLDCCRHRKFLLDADQVKRPELLRYHLKFRFWFQEYTPATPTTPPSHLDLTRYYITTEANAGEYDVPPAFALANAPIPGYPNWPLNTTTPGTRCTGQCPGGSDCACYHELVLHFTPANLSTYPSQEPVENVRLIYAGGHCHAPACQSLALYRNDTGTPELLCLQLPLYGQGSGAKFDEIGFATIPPCLWGEGALDRSVLLKRDTPLFSVQRVDNTHVGHFGEMASWQMRGVAF